MIKRTTQGYEVTSEAGKKLSRADLTKQAAIKRLSQIEYFKQQKAK